MKQLSRIEKIRELWVNVAPLLLILVLVVYLSNEGWKSAHFTNFALVFFACVVASVIATLSMRRRKSPVKEISIEEKYDFTHALLLTSLYYRRNPEGGTLDIIVHDCSRSDTSMLTLQQLRTTTLDLLSMKLITFVEKKYYLTDKFHHYFDESIRKCRDALDAASIIHAMLNSSMLETIPQEDIEVDFFTQEEFDAALRNHPPAAQRQIDEKIQNEKPGDQSP